ncbi:hypothetical protein KIPB_004944 [Kipferlia bialata]|uniref:Uncharacterized protein n=1 Tax=Kipferlia bialata TaxID=797122 RepID=A0A9K3CUT4_9EUKA|nr:hypothetical protein KIPB_004944 [Kipferlia bialata]|eukprot:g4944.t1
MGVFPLPDSVDAGLLLAEVVCAGIGIVFVLYLLLHACAVSRFKGRADGKIRVIDVFIGLSVALHTVEVVSWASVGFVQSSDTCKASFIGNYGSAISAGLVMVCFSHYTYRMIKTSLNPRSRTRGSPSLILCVYALICVCVPSTLVAVTLIYGMATFDVTTPLVDPCWFILDDRYYGLLMYAVPMASFAVLTIANLGMGGYTMYRSASAVSGSAYIRTYMWLSFPIPALSLIPTVCSVVFDVTMVQTDDYETYRPWLLLAATAIPFSVCGYCLPRVVLSVRTAKRNRRHGQGRGGGAQAWEREGGRPQPLPS